MRSNRLFTIFVFAAVVLMQSSAQAATYTWTNTVGGAWSDANNWEGGVVPVSANDTIIRFAGAGNMTTTNDLPDDPFILNKMIYAVNTFVETISLVGTKLSFQGADAEIGYDSSVGGNAYQSKFEFKDMPVILATNLYTRLREIQMKSVISGPGALISVEGGITMGSWAYPTNTYSGGTIVTNSGSVGVIGSQGSPGASPVFASGDITLHEGGTLDGRLTVTNTVNFRGGIWKVSGSGTYQGVLAGDVILNSGYVNTFNASWPAKIYGPVSGAGGFVLTGGGPRTLIITNEANTFAGPIWIAKDILVAPQFNSVSGGTASSALGAPNSVSNGTISLGYQTEPSYFNGACGITYNGTVSETTDRVMSLAGKTDGVTITHDGSDGTLLTFTSDFTVPGVNAKDCRKTLTLSVTQSNRTMEIAGEIPDATLGTAGQTATSIEKTGDGTLTLSGINSYSGATLVNGGTLDIASSGSIGNTASLTITNAVVSLSATTCLGTNTTVYLNEGGTMNLDYAGGIYNIPAIYTNGVLLAVGTYGAANLPTFLSGPGVISTEPPPPAGTVMIIK